MGKDVGRGMSWMLLATVISKVATSVAQVLLGWWLLPEHFRNFAMATTIAGLLMLAKDGGIPNFLNKRGSGEYEDLKGPSFWMCNAYNLAAALLMAVAAYPLAIWYEDPKLAPMLWVMAIALPLGTPAAMLQAKLRLDLRFKAFGMLLVVHFADVGDLGDTRSTPRRPEVDQNDLALVLGFVECFACCIDQAIKGQGLADATGSLLESVDRHFDLGFDLGSLGLLQLGGSDI
jgi:hypothetical protein